MPDGFFTDWFVEEQERESTDHGRFARRTITIGGLGRTLVERVRLFGQADVEALRA